MTTKKPNSTIEKQALWEEHIQSLRKSYHGLAAIIKLKFHLDPYSRCMFAFCNRRRTLIKIL